MEAQKQRYDFIDIAKGIAIISVVDVHINRGFRFLENGITWHLAVFFICSGILMAANKSQISIKKEIKKNTLSLLKPYWIMSTVYIFIYAFVSYFRSENTVNFIVKNIYLTLSGNGIGTLWFLPTLFGSKMLLVILQKRVGRNNILKICICSITVAIATIFLGEYLYANGLVGQLNFSIEGILWNEIILLMQILIASGYISFGYILYYLWEKINCKRNDLIFLTASVVCFALNYLFYEHYRGNNLLYIQIADAYSFIFCTVIGSLAVIFVSLLLERFQMKLLLYCGRYSLIIMTTHLEFKITSFAEYIANISFGSYTWGGVLATTIIIALTEFLIIKLVNGIPILRKVYNIKKITT